MKMKHSIFKITIILRFGINIIIIADDWFEIENYVVFKFNDMLIASVRKKDILSIKF